jgi:sulfur carrier protein
LLKRLQLLLMANTSAIIKFRGKEYTVRANIPVLKAVKMLKIPLNSHLIIRNGELITEDELILPGDHIEMLPVISGG